MVNALPAPEPGENSRFLLDSVGRYQYVDRLADNFGRRVAKQAFRSLIPAHDDAFKAFAHDGVVGRLDDRCEQAGILFGLSYRFDRLVAKARHLQMRFDQRKQLARAEWLGQIVIGTGLQALDPRLFPGPSGE